jgi:hypothetical protein
MTTIESDHPTAVLTPGALRPSRERKGRSVVTLITTVEMMPPLEDQVAAIEAAESDWVVH